MAGTYKYFNMTVLCFHIQGYLKEVKWEHAAVNSELYTMLYSREVKIKEVVKGLIVVRPS